ncbi:long-chain-fatty-acid-CoA ligase [Diaporthe amygdali]|uniref:long-chain-fatty-acid-CoA ligase n=1 Tax=Phomopsis amygdali TaxID=1214568 RepID=UPI0022FF099B|nr:long-chain-fatty-acid-CoA ligase [Diaporthe amygdali]KAJ0122717.1 long-chain-fatty-acid-CoA ligase [Diaporthe amygdali]
MAAQILPSVVEEPNAKQQSPSILHGPVDPPLSDLTLGELLELQCQHNGEADCISIPWTGARWSYDDLRRQSSLIARALLDEGIRHGDRVAIMAGNCEQYAAIFFAVVRIGAILVILNNTYTPSEAMYGLEFTACKIFFTTKKIGRTNNEPLLAQLSAKDDAPKVVVLRGDGEGYRTYEDMILQGSKQDPAWMYREETKVSTYDVCNLQFTSGTTGHPKAAMLTHHNIVNNSRFIGDRMRLTTDDVLCCPPPLFHCFGLVLGLLAAITHGAKIVYPAEVFDGPATIRAIQEEQCTALHGVPAMFDTLLALPEAASLEASNLRLRTGIIAGAPVPRYLMEQLVSKLGMTEFTSSYGLTEASPTCFNAFTDDPIHTRLSTVGTLMPHAHAKIVDRDGNTLPVGERGELLMGGYQLCAGYWNNSEKTAEVMTHDENGMLWLHTGDEAVFNEEGGENIYPLEIEERLMAHPSISLAVVVGLKDEHYGEVVGAFLDGKPTDKGTESHLTKAEVRDWVTKRLGKHKAPAHVFWMGEGGVPATVPLTGSGKVRKFELAKVGEEILSKRVGKEAKL